MLKVKLALDNDAAAPFVTELTALKSEISVSPTFNVGNVPPSLNYLIVDVFKTTFPTLTPKLPLLTDLI